MAPFEYVSVSSASEACDFISRRGEETKVLAGGTDLLVYLRSGEFRPKYVLDIGGLKELRSIKEQNGKIAVGSVTTHSDLVNSPLIYQYGRVLRDAAASIGSPQIRNLGTIGGNVVNASPAADTVPALMVLDAQVKTIRKESSRVLPVADLFIGPYEADLNADEILAEFTFDKLPARSKCVFIKLSRRRAMAIARINLAVMVRLRADGRRLDDIRISVGSVTPTPCRMSAAEDLLRGMVATDNLIEEAARRVSEEVVRRSGIRESTTYKRPVVETLVRRGIKEALG